MEVIAPKISVLIPTYNYGRYLHEAIDSVLAQDFHNYELIVSDDCSSDNTEEIISQYKSDTRIRYYRHKKNLGMVENWNWCLSQARGEFIKFVFGDDKLSRPDALTKLLELMEDNPDATLAASARLIIDHNSDIFTIWNDLGKTGIYDGKKTIFRCLAENRNIIGEPSATLFRKKSADSGFNTRYRQLVDLEFWFQLIEKGDLIFSDEALCCFRKHPVQQTENNRLNGTAEVENIRIFLDFYKKIPQIKENIKWWRFLKIYGIQKFSTGKKHIPPELESARKTLASEISKVEFFIFWMRYKLSNPIKKLFKTFVKCW